MKSQYDVIVAGGGTAGVVAAVAAGRAGASTLLIEKNGCLGGTMTVAGVNFPALFFAEGKQVIAGIGWELVTRTCAEVGQELPDQSDPDSPHSRKHTHVDKAVYAALCDEAVLKAGADLLLHAMPASAERAGDGWRVEVCTKTGLTAVTASVLIDATGDANLVSLAGFEVDRPEPVQPGTLILKLGGYDPDGLDYQAIDAEFRKALKQGEIRHMDVGWHTDGPEGYLRRGGGNANHVTTGPAADSDGRTGAEVEARRSMMRMLRFFRRQKGLEGISVEWFCPEVGVRETVVIRGKGTITGADYQAGRAYDDAVCYCYYPVDVHLDDGEGVDLRPLAAGVLPTIPRGAMLPAGSDRFIVAGRCISGDRVAHSAYRVEAPCMAMGQAAGVMAAVSTERGVDPEQLQIDDVRNLLRAQGAIVPFDV